VSCGYPGKAFKPANAGGINIGLMSPAFAGFFFLSENPQLTLWAKICRQLRWLPQGCVLRVGAALPWSFNIPAGVAGGIL
jgi:hypothetical protein